MGKILKRENRGRRHKRIRAKISGTAKVPRLCVFKSSKHIYAQLIDDEKGETLVLANDSKIKTPKASTKQPTGENARSSKASVAFEVGKLIAEAAAKEKIEKVVFDRGGYQYHGRIKALAEGAREGGLKF